VAHAQGAWWWLLLASSLCLTVGSALSLEDLLRRPKSVTLQRLAPLRTLCLAAFVITSVFVFRLYGGLHALANLLVASVLSLIFMAARMDWKGLLAAQRIQILQREMHRDALKAFWTEKLRKTPEIARLMADLRLEEADLDDYCELIACGWPVQETLRVLQDPAVFEFFFTHPDQSKAEILESVLKIHVPRRDRPAARPAPVVPLRKQNLR